MSLNGFHHAVRVTLLPDDLMSEVLAGARGFLERGSGRCLHALERCQRFLHARRPLGPLVYLLELHFHLPDHLVHAARFDECVLDHRLLVLERLDLGGDVLGQRVQAAQLRIGILAERADL